MDPIIPQLPELVLKLVAGENAVHVAYGHNYLFEERVSKRRQKVYENDLRLNRAELREWRSQHRSYLYRSFYVEPGRLPEAFSAINSTALLPPPAENQWVVRIENLGRLIALQAPVCSVSMIHEQLEILRENEDRDAAIRAQHFLAKLCGDWNAMARSDHRPCFASFEDEVSEDIREPDWPNRLRDRLGLSHYDVQPNGAPIPVALVRYRVSEILSGLADEERKEAFAVPTVLDGEFNGHFFPAPRDAVYGRTLDLRRDEECERLVAEILHRRIEYGPEHILKVGFVSAPVPQYDDRTSFARLRNEHLFCLQYESGRDDFGEEISGDANG